MIRESFPDVVDFQTERTRLEFQGNLLSCTAFGMTSALEAMADRAGQPVQLSPRYLWFYSDKRTLSVDSMVYTVNRVGICKDEFCPYVVSDTYPYEVANADEMPGFQAIIDAQWHPIKVSVERIAGKEQIMRALATGHALITVRTLGASVEHCEAAIGYDKAQGLKIHGSGSKIYWQSWDTLDSITQVYALTCEKYPPVPHPDYVEGDIPTFNDGILNIPLLDLLMAYPEPTQHFQNVRLAFDSFGEVAIGDPGYGGVMPMWSSTRNKLTLPSLIYEGKRFANVSLTKPAVKILHYETI